MWFTSARRVLRRRILRCAVHIQPGVYRGKMEVDEEAQETAAFSFTVRIGESCGSQSCSMRRGQSDGRWKSVNRIMKRFAVGHQVSAKCNNKQHLPSGDLGDH